MSPATSRISESVDAFRGVFRNPDIRRIQLAFAGSVTGNYAYSIAVAVYAYRQGGATAVGILTFARLGAGAAVAPLAASIVDRHPRQRVMLASDLVRVATMGGLALSAMLHSAALVVYALAVVTTVSSTIFRPAESALLPTLANSPEELTAANVSSSTIDSVASFVGPALGALLLAAAGPTVVFFVNAGSFAWSALLVARVHGPDNVIELSANSGEDDDHEGLLAGVRAIRREPRLALLIGLYAAQTLVAGALGVLTVVTALRLLDLGSAGVGILEAASGIGSIIGAGVMLGLIGRNRLGENLGAGIFLWGAPIVLLGVFTNTPIAIMAFLLVGLGNTLVDISAITLLQRTTPAAVAGRVFGVLESALIAGLAFGALAAPALVAIAGPRNALIVTGALLPAVAALAWRQLRHVDDGATVDRQVVDALRGVPFLAPLPVGTLELLAKQVVPVELAADQPLFERGDHGDRFYVLTEGTIEIELPDGAKREEAPAYVGEIALLRDVPRTATVTAITDCTFLALERDDFLARRDRPLGQPWRRPGHGLGPDRGVARPGVTIGMRPGRPSFTMAAVSAPVDLIKRVPLFERLGNRELNTLAATFTERSFQSGQALTTEGQGAAGFFVIESGSADVTVAGAERRTLGPGDYYGEIALLDGGARTATITATSDGKSYGLTSWQFRPLVEEHASIAWPLLEALAARIRQIEAR